MPKNETKALLDLALHPVRMRILMLLAGSPGLTSQQMAEQMRDIPQATLYRQIGRLAQAGLLRVTAERPVRGTVEKVYALDASGAGQASPEAAARLFSGLSKADHLRYFTAFTLSLIGDFERFLNRAGPGPLDLAADGVGYHKLALFLSDGELAGLAGALNQAIAPYLGLEDAPGRKKRLFSTILMPEADAEPVETSLDND